MKSGIVEKVFAFWFYALHISECYKYKFAYSIENIRMMMWVYLVGNDAGTCQIDVRDVNVYRVKDDRVY